MTLDWMFFVDLTRAVYKVSESLGIVHVGSNRAVLLQLTRFVAHKHG